MISHVLFTYGYAAKSSPQMLYICVFVCLINAIYLTCIVMGEFGFKILHNNLVTYSLVHKKKNLVTYSTIGKNVQDDESLRRWKEQLLGIVDLEEVGGKPNSNTRFIYTITNRCNSSQILDVSCLMYRLIV